MGRRYKSRRYPPYNPTVGLRHATGDIGRDVAELPRSAGPPGSGAGIVGDIARVDSEIRVEGQRRKAESRQASPNRKKGRSGGRQ